MSKSEINQHAPLRAKYKATQSREIWVYVYCGLCKTELEDGDRDHTPLKAKAYISDMSVIDIRVHILEQHNCR